MTEIDKERELLERDVRDLRDQIAAIEDQDLVVAASADGTRIRDIDPKDSLPEYERRYETAQDRLQRYIRKQEYSKASGG